ncbi:aminotransferase class V-fold PLP-dependent enzyme [Nocardioides sp. AN3]
MSPAAFRDNFPGLDELVHLASCSQGALSDLVSASQRDYHQTLLDRGAAWDVWMTQVHRARELFAASIGASTDDIALVASASEGAYQVASTQSWGDRPVVVTTDMEFPSVAHVWLAQRQRGAQVRFVSDHDWQVDVEDYEVAIGSDTKLVSTPLISYRNGLRMPVAAIAAQAHEAGARVFVDAYQGFGVEPIDVTELGCDYLVTGTLKYALGLPGLAFLYVRPGLHDDQAPTLTGWFGRVDPYAFDPRHLDHPEHARRFEAGTPAVPSVYAAVAGLSLLAELDPRVVREHVAGLSRHLHEELMAMGRTVCSPATDERRGPQVALRDDDPERLEAHLRKHRISSSPRGEVVRLSFHYYNTHSDVERFLTVLRDYRAN